MWFDYKSVNCELIDFSCKGNDLFASLSVLENSLFAYFADDIIMCFILVKMKKIAQIVSKRQRVAMSWKVAA